MQNIFLNIKDYIFGGINAGIVALPLVLASTVPEIATYAIVRLEKWLYMDQFG